MQRRDFITMLGGSAMAWPLAADAQQPTGRVYRVGYLAFASREHQAHLSKAFEEGLRSLGYRVGQNVLIEYRYGNGQLERHGEKKLVVGPETVVVTYVMGSKDDLKPGTKIFVSAAKKQPDGSLQTPRITYGRNGAGPAF